MGGRSLAMAVVVFLLTTPVGLAAPAGTGAKACDGRAADPPLSPDWNITGDTVIDTTVDYHGNITVSPLASLNITNGSWLAVLGSSGAAGKVVVMYGASLNIINGSGLVCDNFESMTGSGLHITGGSNLSVRGALHIASSHPTILDSSVVAGGFLGMDADLSIDCTSWGDFQRSNFTVVAQDGWGGDAGAPGEHGGNVSLFMENTTLYDCRITAVAGRGGDGGQGVAGQMNGGDGGSGGNLSASFGLGYISGCTMDLEAGDGGEGAAGAGFSQHDGGDGGRGGDGGAAVIDWRGTNLLLSGSSLTLKAGGTGPGGRGGDALSPGATGGGGGDGGRGGPASAAVSAQGTFTVTDSSFSVQAGNGSKGGLFGGPGGDGTPGTAGRAGDGGSAQFACGLWDDFSADGSSLSVLAGGGGAGGSGIQAQDGGAGGDAGLNVSVQTSSSVAAFTVGRCSISACGGGGGDGGTVPSPNGSAGRPGNGGRGGSAAMEFGAEGGLQADETALACSPGTGGTAASSGAPGNAGAAYLRLFTGTVYLSNSTVSQTIGPVGDGAHWTLDSTYVNAEPHFNFTGRGTVEEYWTKRVGVKDVHGDPIMDGSVTVYVQHNGTLVDSQRSSSRGEAEFRLLDILYSLAGPQYRSYTLSARDTRGRFSQNISVFWEPDFFVDLALLSKGKAPTCAIRTPAPENLTVITASAFVDARGNGVPYLLGGVAVDNPLNDDPGIEQVQVRFGDVAPWLDAALRLEGGGWEWNFSWDVFGWASRQLEGYPLGIIPVNIYARSYNGFFWSDDQSRGGAPVFVNVTVRLLSMPPRPPIVEITSPKEARPDWVSEVDVLAGKSISFNAQATAAMNARVTGWVWCFDDTSGFREDYVSNSSPAVNHSYPLDRANGFFYAILKVYDNESQRRVALLHAGVAYGEFGYDFDPADGSVSVKIKITVRSEPSRQQPAALGPWWLLGIIILAGAAISLFFWRRSRRPAGRSGR